MYSLKDDQVMQNLLIKLFRDIKELPDDATVITISQNKREEWLITMMAICDEVMLNSFRDYDDLDVALSLRYEPDIESKGLDFTVRLDIYSPIDHIILESVVPHIQNNEQKALAKLLLDGAKLTLFVVNHSRELEYIVRVNYDAELYKLLLESILEVKHFEVKCSRCGVMYKLDSEVENYVCQKCIAKEIYQDYEL